MDRDKGDIEMGDVEKDSQSAADQNSAQLGAKNEPEAEAVLKEPSKSSAESLENNIDKSEVHGQLSNGEEDKPDGLVNPKTQVDDQCNSHFAEEDQSHEEGLSENHSIGKGETTDTADLPSTEKGQISSESGNDGGNLAVNEVDDQQAHDKAGDEKNSTEQLFFQLPVSEVPPKKKETTGEIPQSVDEDLVKGLLDKAHGSTTGALMNDLEGSEKTTVLSCDVSEEKIKEADRPVTELGKPSLGDSTPFENKHLPASPDHPVQSSTTSSGGYGGVVRRSGFSEVKMTDSDDGTPEEQAAFMKELESFHREREVEFKPPKFYGQMLNCLKLWRSVIKLGGYDPVTGAKLWRQIGESFHPPKTCTTVSWTFRIFYEKSLLEYERYLKQIGELQLPVAALSEPSYVDNEGNSHQLSGPGRARRDAAARAMQGWHVQRLFGQGEVSEPVVKDKNLASMPKRENKVKRIGSIKQKRPDEVELPVKAPRLETSKQLSTTVVDVGPPADWVKINVRESKDCFEVYALVPGLLREEVRVQSDPAGRLVITGQPEQADNPWGITAFKKVVTLPARIDPLQTSAVVSLHGRLFVRVPFEQSRI